MAKVATGLLSAPDAIGDTFGNFITNPVQPLFWMVAYLALNIMVVVKGVSSGIEKAGKVLMPLLFGMLILIAISLVGYVIWRLVQAFSDPENKGTDAKGIFTRFGYFLSGVAYAKGENLVENAAIVTVMDTAVALLAGVAMFPAMFAFGIEPAAGPGLVFVVVPTLFAEMGGIGALFAGLFFVALSVAALTSSVSLLEVVVAYLMDEKKFARPKAVVTASSVMALMCILASLSLGDIGPKLFGTGAFDVFDLLTDKIFLAIGGLLSCIFATWKLSKEDLKDEVTNGGKVSFAIFELWYSLVKFVIPVTIAIVAISGIKSGFDNGVGAIMVVGVLIIGVFAAL